MSVTAPDHAAELSRDLALPAFDARALARRAAPLGAALAAALAVALVAGGPLRAFEHAFAQALAADPRWVGAALALELASFGGYVALLALVGGRATPQVGLRASVQVTLGGAAATRLLPTGGAGGAALTLWFFRRAGLGARDATRTLLTFLVVLYSVFLGSIVVAGALLASGLAPGDGPLALSALPAAGAAGVMLGALAVGARRGARREGVLRGPVAASRVARARAGLRELPDTLGGAVRDAAALVRGGDPRLLGAFAWWGFDAAVLFAMVHALGGALPLAVLALGYFVGQVANTLPVPGAASGGMVGVLLAFGVEPGLALGAVLGYRAVAIWLPAPFGLAALPGLRTTVAGWARVQPAAPSA